MADAGTLQRYDFSRSTAENYARGKEEEIVSPIYRFQLRSRFSGARARLDYTYHPTFCAARVAVQDGIVASALGRRMPATENVRLKAALSVPKRPWLIFTAGAMGAGKSHVMRWMDSRRLIRLCDFIRIDPDELRQALRETSGYIARNPQTAGVLTQRAPFLADLLLEVTLEAGRPAIVDGSLRNAQWYEQLFAKIPIRYRKAIVSVEPEPAVVYEGGKTRA